MNRFVIVQFPCNGGNGRYSGKLTGTKPPMAGDHLIPAILHRTDDDWVENTDLHDAVDGLLHEFIIVIHPKWMIVKGTYFFHWKIQYLLRCLGVFSGVGFLLHCNHLLYKTPQTLLICGVR